ncbi:MAG: hypothetical protein ACE363_07820 [Alphaproteobacteria bacterium]
MRKLSFSILFAGTLLASFGALAQGGESGSLDHDIQTTRGVIEDDLFTAGGTVDVDARVGGDVVAAGGVMEIFGRVGDGLIAAGGEVNTGAAVAGDAIVAGGVITVDGPVGDNLYAAGGRVSVDSDITGKVIAAGGRVRLGREATVVEDVVISAGSTTVAGQVNGDLRINAGHAIILGEINGDVSVQAQQLEIGPDARIAGTLSVRSPEPAMISDQAEIVGEVTQVRTSSIFGGERDDDVTTSIYFRLYMIALAALIQLIAPGFVRRSADRLMDRPISTLGVGLLGLTATPVILLLLIVIVIGIPFALIGLAAYGAALLLAVPLFSLLAAHWFLRRGNPDRVVGRWPVIGLAAAALIVLFLIGLIPFLGGLVRLGVLCLGIGAAIMVIWQATRPAPAVVD